MQEKKYGILSLPVLVAALGYFVDIYDLLLFSIIRIPSLKSFGLNDDQIAKDGLVHYQYSNDGSIGRWNFMGSSW